MSIDTILGAISLCNWRHFVALKDGMICLSKQLSDFLLALAFRGGLCHVSVSVGQIH